jgi:hypothetical protein
MTAQVPEHNVLIYVLLLTSDNNKPPRTAMNVAIVGMDGARLARL